MTVVPKMRKASAGSASTGMTRRLGSLTDSRSRRSYSTLRFSLELGQRLALDLADALAGQAEALADLLERLRLLVVEAEPHPQHGRLALVHLVEQHAGRA